MEPNTETDDLDRADMARLVDSDDLALNRIMARHAAAVLRVLGQLVGNADDARDLAQETFARVYRARDRFRAGARFRPWLLTIAANLARNHLRWRARHPNLSLETAGDAAGQPLGATLPAPGPDPAQDAAQADRLRAVRHAVDALPANLRAPLVLCAWEDLTMAEAAGVLVCTPKAVEALLYRARQLLRERLGGAGT